MKERKIYVEIGGGCYRNAANLPDGCTIEVIDWDNLLGGDGADTAAEWNRLDTDTRQFIKKKYPEDYKSVTKRLESPNSN